MHYLVLGIGYSRSEYEQEKTEWKKYGIDFDFVDSVRQAVEKLPYGNYVCVTICTDYISHDELNALREVRPIPVLVLPPASSVAERYPLVHFSAAQYLHTAESSVLCGADNITGVQQYLDLPDRKPLTIITVQDLCFCLEYRSVEVRGQEIDLTAKEFDILTLLIMNQRRVFTYEMLYEQVWKEPSDYYTKKTLITHISTLRKKLRIAEGIPDYIKSVHGKGYKFDAGV